VSPASRTPPLCAAPLPSPPLSRVHKTPTPLPFTRTPKRNISQLTHNPADIVQDLYLKELKAYKAPAVKASDSEGHVQKFSIPAAPPSPEEADIASELKAYEGQAAAGAAPVEQDWFEEPVEEEEGHGAH
jgi:F-type H+-transporting ATPase subunit h